MMESSEYLMFPTCELADLAGVYLALTHPVPGMYMYLLVVLSSAIHVSNMYPFGGVIYGGRVEYACWVWRFLGS
jgi:hypothetical protein